MPNHVTNRITGPAAILDRLTRAATDDDATGHNVTPDGRVIDFNLLIPEPENNPDWYDWRVNHWGTKWNAYTPTITTHDDGTVTIEFETAWSAPSGIINELTIRDSVTIKDDTPAERTDEALDYAARLCHGQTYAEYQAENI